MDSNDQTLSSGSRVFCLLHIVHIQAMIVSGLSYALWFIIIYLYIISTAGLLREHVHCSLLYFTTVLQTIASFAVAFFLKR